MEYSIADVKKWTIVFLEENNFFMAHEATKLMLYTPPGEDIASSLVVQTIYTEYINIMSKRPPAIKIPNDREEIINLVVRIKDNQIVEAFTMEDEHEE